MLTQQHNELMQGIAKWEESCPTAQKLKAICEEQLIHAYYFGGVCRSVMEGTAPRDIDVVVDTLMWEKFALAIQGITTTRANSFGGMKFKLEGMSVDAWALDNTWAFANGISYPASPTLLPETTFLNIESVVAMVWHPEEPWMFEKGFFDAMHTRTIEIQNPNTPCPALCVARIRKFESRGWKRGASVDAFLEYHFANGLTEGDIADETSRHYACEAKVGDYVLATKYNDGGAQDHWCVGFYAGFTNPEKYDPPRYDVVDNEGKNFRGNGFRRVEVITPERGAWILKHTKDIELSDKSLWYFARCPMDTVIRRPALIRRPTDEDMQSIELRAARATGKLAVHVSLQLQLLGYMRDLLKQANWTEALQQAWDMWRRELDKVLALGPTKIDKSEVAKRPYVVNEKTEQP